MHMDLRFPVAAGLVLVAGCAVPPAAEAQKPGDRIPAEKGEILVWPIEHASLVLKYGDRTIYVDPVGGAKRYAGLWPPDIVLLTHEHFDHLDLKTLKGLISAQSRAKIIAPKSVADKLPAGPLADRTTVLAAGEKTEVEGAPIEAVPAYNTTPQRQRFHPKGRDLGYVLQLAGKRIYVAGDTEDTPEMRSLKDIDVAFLPMNLPYTMDIQQAADALRQFRPKIVYPYHYRNEDGSQADLGKLKRLVGDQAGVEVRVLQWYP